MAEKAEVFDSFASFRRSREGWRSFRLSVRMISMLCLGISLIMLWKQVRNGKNEERVVSISTISKEGFIRIHEENFFDGDLIYENNVLKTTKQNKLYHGFGVKSIKLIAEKYHGDVSISAKDGKFILDILFPIQK